MPRKVTLKDDQFEMLMNKERAKEYIGIDDIDSLIKYEGLDKAVFKPRGRGSVLFNKIKINEWLESLA